MIMMMMKKKKKKKNGEFMDDKYDIVGDVSSLYMK